jgi:hypothetical protein
LAIPEWQRRHQDDLNAKLDVNGNVFGEALVGRPQEDMASKVVA